MTGPRAAEPPRSAWARIPGTAWVGATVAVVGLLASVPLTGVLPATGHGPCGALDVAPLGSGLVVLVTAALTARPSPERPPLPRFARAAVVVVLLAVGLGLLAHGAVFTAHLCPTSTHG